MNCACHPKLQHSSVCTASAEQRLQTHSFFCYSPLTSAQAATTAWPSPFRRHLLVNRDNALAEAAGTVSLSSLTSSCNSASSGACHPSACVMRYTSCASGSGLGAVHRRLRSLSSSSIRLNFRLPLPLPFPRCFHHDASSPNLPLTGPCSRSVGVWPPSSYPTFVLSLGGLSWSPARDPHPTPDLRHQPTQNDGHHRNDANQHWDPPLGTKPLHVFSSAPLLCLWLSAPRLDLRPWRHRLRRMQSRLTPKVRSRWAR